MSKTKIEWATHVWNPVTGCNPVSEGCQNCYAQRMANRLRGRFGYPENDPFKVTLHQERLEEPLRWREPKRVFVCSMGDLFHEDVPFRFISYVFNVMAHATWHTFLVLTKRPTRMLEWFQMVEKYEHLDDSMFHLVDDLVVGYREWPLPNVWLGVTAENQARADERIPVLLQIPTAVRFVSVEPMLGPVDLSSWLGLCRECGALAVRCGPALWREGRKCCPDCTHGDARLNWIICGGETGPNARPMHPDWVRSLRDQCQAAGVPFFLKQMHIGGNLVKMPELDGRTWDEYPEVTMA